MKFTVIATLLATAAVASAQSSSSDVVTASSAVSSALATTSAAASAAASATSAAGSALTTGSVASSVVIASGVSTSAAVASPAPTQTWFPSGPITPPAALPPQTWTILQLTSAQRQDVCTRQTAACTNNCGGPGKDPMNFCNITSMAWGCGCSTKVPDFPVYLWPIVETECTDKGQACQSECLTLSNAQVSACQVACTSYFQCGSANAPPSYLQTNSSTETPSYVAPAPVANTTTSTTSTSPKSSAAKNTAELLGSVVLAIVIVVGVAMV